MIITILILFVVAFLFFPKPSVSVGKPTNTDTRTRSQIKHDEIIKRKLEQMDKEQDDKAWEDQFGS